MSFSSFDPSADIANKMAQINEMHELQRKNAERLAGRYDAAEIFKHLQRRIKHFQSTLPVDKEIGLQLANFGIAAEIHIRQIGYRDPNIVEFAGIISDGQEVLLVQHISQLNFLMIAVSPPKEEEAYRIGFRAE